METEAMNRSACSSQSTNAATLLKGSKLASVALLAFLFSAAWSTPADAQQRRGQRRGPVGSGARSVGVCDTETCDVAPNSRGSRRVSRRVGGRSHRLACGCQRVWHAGHYKVERQRVQGPGYYEQVWVPARYQTRYDCGRRVTVKVRNGYYKSVHRPGRVRFESRRVFVPGHYDVKHTCKGRRHRGTYVRRR